MRRRQFWEVDIAPEGAHARLLGLPLRKQGFQCLCEQAGLTVPLPPEQVAIKSPTMSRKRNQETIPHANRNEFRSGICNSNLQLPCIRKSYLQHKIAAFTILLFLQIFMLFYPETLHCTIAQWSFCCSLLLHIMILCMALGF